MNANTLIDPSKLSEQQLEDLLRTKRQKTEQDRKAYKELVNSTVPNVVTRLMTVSDDLSAIKAETFSYFRDLLGMKATVFGVIDDQQSHTFSTDKYSITIGYRVNDGWDDTVSAGIQKVTAYLESLAKDPNSTKLSHSLFQLLKKDKNGNLRASRVLELKQMSEEYANVDFTDGVNIIQNAYKPVKSCWFIEAFYINDAQQKVSIPLAMSSVDFPEGFSFDFSSADESSEEEA